MPHELGWLAGLQGRDPRVCPYPKMTKDYRRWQMFHGFAVDLMRACNPTETVI